MVAVLACPTPMAAASPALYPVVLVDTAPASLWQPADGRIAGDGFVATVSEAIAPRLTPGGVAAPKGSRFDVFELAGDYPGEQVDGSTVTATVRVDGAPEPVPAARSAPATYVATVPVTAADVDVSLTASGFTQSFSLTEGRRVGPQPTVLYRARADGAPTDPVSQTASFATPIPGDPSSGQAATDITLTSSVLTWFGPDPNMPNPPGPAEAFLVLHLTSGQDPNAGPTHVLAYDSALPPAAITLSVPGGRPVPAILTGEGGPDDQTTTRAGWVGGDYYFTVPATLTAATVTITPGTVSLESNFLVHFSATDQVPGHATFPLTFPPLYTSPPSAPPPLQQAALPANESGLPGATGGSGSGHSALIVALAAAAVTGFVVLVLARRRRRPLVVAGPVAAGTAAGSDPQPDWQPPARPPDPWAPPSPATIRPGLPPPSAAAPDPPSMTVAAEPATPLAVPALVPIPSGPPGPPVVPEVQILGPVQGAWPGDPPEPSTVTELAAYLVLHPGGHCAARLAEVLSNESRTVNVETIRTYIAALRRAVGANHLPMGGAGGYTLTGIGTDWDRFTAHAASVDVTGLVTALALVRGEPFSEPPAGAYEWAHHTRLVQDVEHAIVAAALTLAGIAETAGDHRLAGWATDQAWLVAPLDQPLHAAALSRAARRSPDHLSVAWRDVKRHHARRDEPVPDSLTARYLHLRNHPPID